MAIDAYRIDPGDNVATLLVDAGPGPATIGDGASTSPIELGEPIELGHKVALAFIAEGAPVVKYGVTIGFATRPIARGAWVHLHNCKSGFDEASSALDLHTGTTETRYE